MKRLLLFISFAILSIGVQAQKIADMQKAPAGIMQRALPKTFCNPSRFQSISSAKAMNKVPMFKAELAENERLIGVYTTDEWGEQGGSVIRNGKAYKAFAIVPAANTKRFMGGSLHAIRFALAEVVTINSVFVMGVTKDGYIVPISETSTAGQLFSVGWNKVDLNEPVTLSDKYDSYAIGYEYVETPNKYPLSVLQKESDAGFCLIGDLGQGESFYNLSSNGVLCVQGFVTVNNLPVVDVAVENMIISSTLVEAGSKLVYAYSAYNFGTEAVSSYEIQIKLDGKLVQTVTEKNQPITDTPTYYQGNINVPSDIAYGSHTVSAELVQVNGAAPTAGTGDDYTSTTFATYLASDVVARQKHLVEEVTSHSCTYCPYGAAVVEALLQQSDKIAVACVHGNMSAKDPYNTQECEDILDYLGIMTFPSGAFNRIYFDDEHGILPSLGFNSGYDNVAKQFITIMDEYSTPAFASVNIDKALSEDGKTLSIKVSGKGGAEASKILEGFGLTVYIIEDRLKNRQLNLGKWVSDYTHNHVLRKVATAINGDDIKWTSASAYENTFEVALDDSWVRDNISIIAFISKRQSLSKPDWTDMGVSNANSVKLTANTVEDPDDEIPGDNPGGDSESVDAGIRVTPLTATTQLLGEGMSANAKYVVGTNYYYYAPCIWDTETNDFVNFPQYEEGALHAVNNDGVAVGSSRNNGGKAMIVHTDGTSEILKDNGGANTQGSDAWCVSADGKTIGGFYYYFEWKNEEQTEGFYATFPCVWQDKKCITLPYPSKNEIGFNVDGAGLRWMSADASILLGYLVDDMATWPIIIWRKNAEGNYEYDASLCKRFYGEKYASGKPYMKFSPAALSANGEWIVLTVQKSFDENGSNIPSDKIARYNLKTDQLEVLGGGIDEMVAPSAISDEGTVLMYTSNGDIFGRTGYVWKAGETKANIIDDMLRKVNGMPDFNTNTPVAFAADNKTILGFGIDDTRNFFSYVIDINKMEEAINGIQKPTVSVPQYFSDGIYTITGRKVLNMNQPGLYIKNGKKVMVK